MANYDALCHPKANRLWQQVSTQAQAGMAIFPTYFYMDNI